MGRPGSAQRCALLGTRHVSRVAVVIDLEYAWNAGRRTFLADDGGARTAHTVLSAPLIAEALAEREAPGPQDRRQIRTLAGVHVVVPTYNMQRHPLLASVVGRWRSDRRVQIHVAPQLPIPALHTARAVLITMVVTNVLTTNQCDVAILMAGDLGLAPLVRSWAEGQGQANRVELVAWSTGEGPVRNPLAEHQSHVWCHRLGHDDFQRFIVKRPT